MPVSPKFVNRWRPSLALVLPALAVLAAACSSSRASNRVVDLVGGEGAAAVLAAPSQGVTRTAYRIDGMARISGTAHDDRPTIHGFPTLAGPIPVDEVSSVELSDVLLSDDTYMWDVSKACMFLPGVAIRYTSGGTTVDVLFCFSCDELETYVDGVEVGHEDFDARRADLVRVAKRLFPDDEAIQGLR